MWIKSIGAAQTADRLIEKGGAIALRVAFHHSDIYGKVGGFSAAVPDSWA